MIPLQLVPDVPRATAGPPRLAVSAPGPPRLLQPRPVPVSGGEQEPDSLHQRLEPRAREMHPGGEAVRRPARLSGGSKKQAIVGTSEHDIGAVTFRKGIIYTVISWPLTAIIHLRTMIC